MNLSLIFSMLASTTRNTVHYALVGVTGIVLIAAGTDGADAPAQEPTGPHGLHRAEATTKGSRRVVLIDGNPGPTFDELIWVKGQYFQNFNQMVHRKTEDRDMNSSNAPVVFSEDGLRYAYVGRQGNEYVLILDGKEYARGPFSSDAIRSLGFAPGGRRLCYIFKGRLSESSDALIRLMVEGSPDNPPLANLTPREVCFSRDGEHYAYYFTFPNSNRGEDKTTHLLVDGHVDPPEYAVQGYEFVTYVESHLSPLFTGDAKHLITVRIKPGNPQGKSQSMKRMGPQTVFLDQKPFLEAPMSPTQPESRGQPLAGKLTEISTAPAGTNLMTAFQTSTDNLYHLFFNQQPVAEVHKIDEIAWSPDGARYAVKCGTEHNTVFMIIDGKQRPDYRSIYMLGEENGRLCYDVWGACRAFTSDSSKSVYVGISDKYFLVVEDQESDAFAGIDKVTLSKEGAEISYVATDDKGKTIRVVDGKVQP